MLELELDSQRPPPADLTALCRVAVQLGSRPGRRAMVAEMRRAARSLLTRRQPPLPVSARRRAG